MKMGGLSVWKRLATECSDRSPAAYVAAYLPAGVAFLLIVLMASCSSSAPDAYRCSIACEINKPEHIALETAIHENFDIVGRQAFQVRIETALFVLGMKSPEDFAFVHSHVPRFVETKRSGMNVYANPPTAEINGRRLYGDPVLNAGILAHEAFHGYQYQNRAGDDMYWTFQHEREAIAYQVAVLRRLGAPPEAISRLEQLDGTHIDLDGDGDFDADDYRMRPW